MTSGETSDVSYEAVRREQKLRFDILDAFREVVAFYSPDHHIIWLNKAGKEQLGIIDESYIGKLCHKVWFNNDGPCPSCPVVSRNLVSTERLVNLTGDRIWMVRHTPLFNNSGILEGFIEFRADITQISELEKQVLDEREKYRMLAENSPFGLLLTRNTEPVYINRILRFWLGIKTVDELVWKDIIAIFHPDDRKQAERLIRMLLEKSLPLPVAERLRIITRDGKIHFFRIELKNSRINGQEYVQTVIMDVTSDIMREKKQKQVAADALYISQKNNILSEIESNLSKTLMGSRLRQFSGEFDKIFETINGYKQLDKDWNMFTATFEEVHPGFFRRLKNAHSSLTLNDIRHCACIKMNLGTKEIARFFNIKAPSVQISRVRLKKKMELSDNTDLRSYILRF
jgi:PAS domain S-box-containing protein